MNNEVDNNINGGTQLNNDASLDIPTADFNNDPNLSVPEPPFIQNDMNQSIESVQNDYYQDFASINPQNSYGQNMGQVMPQNNFDPNMMMAQNGYNPNMMQPNQNMSQVMPQNNFDPNMMAMQNGYNPNMMQPNQNMGQVMPQNNFDPNMMTMQNGYNPNMMQPNQNMGMAVMMGQNNVNQNMEVSNGINQPSAPITPQVTNNPPVYNTGVQSNNNQTSVINTLIIDDELLLSFVGYNYDKITSRTFNFAGFFFSSLYMFYRKMFVYAILTFFFETLLIYLSKTILLALFFNLIIGIFVNKMYLSFARKNIADIKANNQNKSLEELKALCSIRGGTNTGKIFLGLLIELGISIGLFFILSLVGLSISFKKLFTFDGFTSSTNSNNSTIKDIKDNKNDTNQDKPNGTLIENPEIIGSACIGKKCSLIIEDPKKGEVNYDIGVSNSELITILNKYEDYINYKLYYEEENSKREIVDYRIYIKSNNYNITNKVKNENELRNEIGFYSVGLHTDTFTLKEKGTEGYYLKGDKSYTYTDYVFTNSKNISIKMKYIKDKDNIKISSDKKYTITFDVTKSVFEYEYVIRNIKEQVSS